MPADTGGAAPLGEPSVLSSVEANVPAGALELRWRELSRRTSEHALTRAAAADAERQVRSSRMVGANRRFAGMRAAFHASQCVLGVFCVADGT